jgi:hypothetical protein
MATTPCAAAPERRRNLLFLRAPALWPAWPFLPVVRRGRGEDDPECGLVYDFRGTSGRTGYSATVLLANLFEAPRSEAGLLALPKEVFDTADELFDAGWRVD